MTKRFKFIISSLFCLFSLMLLILPLVSAVDLTINTRPYQGLVVRVNDPATGATIFNLYPKSDGNGTAFANFTTSKEEVDFSVFVVRSGEVSDSKVFEGYSTSKPI